MDFQARDTISSLALPCVTVLIWYWLSAVFLSCIPTGGQADSIFPRVSVWENVQVALKNPSAKTNFWSLFLKASWPSRRSRVVRWGRGTQWAHWREGGRTVPAGIYLFLYSFDRWLTWMLLHFPSTLSFGSWLLPSCLSCSLQLRQHSC